MGPEGGEEGERGRGEGPERADLGDVCPKKGKPVENPPGVHCDSTGFMNSGLLFLGLSKKSP